MVVRPYIKSLFEGEALKKLGASSPFDLYLKFGDSILESFIFGVTVQGLDLNDLNTKLTVIRISPKTVVLVGSIIEWRRTFITNKSEFLDQVFSIIKQENRIFKLRKDGEKWTLKN